MPSSSVHSTTLDVPTRDGVADSYLAHPDDGAAHPGVLVYMDAIGLRPRMREMAERIAAEGYTVLAPNLFHRNGRAPVVPLPDLGEASAREGFFKQLGPVMTSFTPEAAASDAASYLDWMAASEQVADGPVAVAGYCMGGRLALRTAGLFPDRVAAAASFHGARLADDEAADSPHLLAADIRAELYVGHADHDHSMPPEQIRRLEEALDAAGVTYRSEVYEGAEHGYTMADTAAYDAAAEQRHWRELFALLDRTLAG